MPALPARAALSAWFRPRRGAYPWRRSRPDPYHVLLSEVMLQQTQVARVAPAFARFLARFPTVAALAEAPRSEVVRTWEGLGYNRRAVALSEAARAIVRDHRGRVPRDPVALRALPGVGPYTAAAVASIAFRVPVPALDTNAKRVTARFLLGRDWPEVPPDDLWSAASRWIDRTSPGQWNQALMDLGREVCRPVPRCDACPLARWCRYRPNRRPRVEKSPPKPAFEGSNRQIRGAVIRRLRRGPARLRELAESIGGDPDRTFHAVRSLVGEGLVTADPSVLSGSTDGGVALAD